jgi:hypothetical protein
VSTEPTTTTTNRDALNRGIRTLFQVGTVTLLIQGYNLFASTPLTADQTAWATAFGTMIVSFVQNMLEDSGAIPSLLKGDPTPDLNARKIEALAVSAGEQDDRLERLEEAARRGSAPEPPDVTPPPERG